MRWVATVPLHKDLFWSDEVAFVINFNDASTGFGLITAIGCVFDAVAGVASGGEEGIGSGRTEFTTCDLESPFPLLPPYFSPDLGASRTLEYEQS